jgi:hypothetical protein
MFAWFRPTCPVDSAAKAWIEERLRWLDCEFPESAFNDQPIVLPTADFFPDPYDGSEEAVRTMLDRVCGYMGVAPSLVDLELVPDGRKIWLVNESGQYLPHAAGTYEEGEERFIVRVDESELDHPMGLVGTIAHELAHVLLLGESRIPADSYDNELLTDLTVVFHGLGIFLANTPRVWDSQYGRWPGTDLKKPEYMTPPMFGYALGHLAWFRHESKPAWARHLRWDVRANLRQGLRFLERIGDSTFKPWHAKLGLEVE